MDMKGRMIAAGRWIRDVFFPHEGNGHRPHLLRPGTVAFVCLIALAAELGFFLAATYFVPRTKFFGIIDANALVDETNQARQDNGVASLAVNPLLTAAAQDKANDMVVNDYFAHISPSGITPWYWFEKVGYMFSAAGENLAVNFIDSQDVTTAWMNSPEHRANILDGQFTQIGIATAQGTYDGHPATYVVELFGTPASVPIAFMNSASAAVAAPIAPTQSPVQAQVPVPAKTTTAPAPKATSPQSSTKPRASVPAVVTSTATASSAAPIAITVPALEPAVTTTVAGVRISAQPADQVNALQWLVSNPAALTNDFYYALMVLFAGAVILNLFVKVRVRFPHLILGGMTVVVLAGLLILFNQNVGILHAAIL